MDIDVRTLKDTVVRKNMTLDGLAYEMGIDRSTLYRRLKKGDAGITLRDARTISKSLRLTPTEAMSIFGGGYVTRL